MKRNLITIILFITTTTCFAQTVNWGAKAGVNFAKQVYSDNFPLSSNNTTGYNLGIIMDIGYSNFSIQPGFFVTTKGERFRYNTVDANQNAAGASNDRYTLTYLELPVNLIYKIRLIQGFDVHLGAGPYFAYGVSAKRVINGVTYPGAFSDHSADPGYSGVYYKNPDYGFNSLAGVLLQNKYLIDFQYGLGLGNLSYSTTTTLKNRVMSVSVGYMFK